MTQQNFELSALHRDDCRLCGLELGPANVLYDGQRYCCLNCYHEDIESEVGDTNRPDEDELRFPED